MYKVYLLRPIQGGISSVYSPMQDSYQSMRWPSVNYRIGQRSAIKRWGYSEDRDLGDGVNVQNITKYDKIDATSLTLFLSDSDLYKRETGTNKTWSYQTESYTTGTVTNITTTTVTGNGTSWDTSGLAAGDKFILDDDYTSDEEPAGGDANWATIASVDNATQISLSSAYTGTTGAMSKTYTTRLVYTTPSNERWSTAIVDDKFCFTNGDTDVMYYDGSATATALDSTNAKQARYCIEYANRLVLADLLVSGVRDPLMVQWSAEGDPTDWTSGDAGSVALLETFDKISGLGRVGANLIVYKTDSYVIANETGIATSPIDFPRIFKGTGCVAPSSIIEFRGKNAFLGRDDFYIIESDVAVPIGGGIRDKFFDIISDTEVTRVWGFHNPLLSELSWFANTTEGKRTFTYNYRYDMWYPYDFAHTMTCGGRGAS